MAVITDKLPEQDGCSDANPVTKRKAHRVSVPRSPEVRFWTPEGLEVREADTAGNLVTITGKPIMYNTWYEVHDIFGTFQERMLPGVADHVIASQADVRFLFNHGGMPLARTASGTLQLRSAQDGLQFEAQLDIRQSLARDLVIAIERGDVSQMSAGFIVAPGGDEWEGDQRSIRFLHDLLDVSAVTYPASPSTTIEVAQRMMAQAPVETYTRLEKMYVDLRAGKVLSQANQDKLVTAVKTLHDVLINAGATLDTDNDDGTEGGSDDDQMDADTGAVERHPDDQDPEEVTRPALTGSRAIDLERELLELRRRQ